MESTICHPTSDFDFSKLSLAHPTGVQGGAYFTKLLNNGTSLYIQAPKCQTKQGIIKAGKKQYCDLMFSGENVEFIEWLENLETYIHTLIFDKRNAWFHTPLDMTDIESAFTSPIRIYKSGKYYLVRAYVQSQKNIKHPSSLQIYDETENILDIDSITNESNIITILEVRGIKFSTRNFQIELALKQIMLVKESSLFNNCLIKPNPQALENIQMISTSETDIENPETAIVDDKTVSSSEDADKSKQLDGLVEEPEDESKQLDAGSADKQEEDEVKPLDESKQLDGLGEEPEDEPKQSDESKQSDEPKQSTDIMDKIDIKGSESSLENTESLVEVNFNLEDLTKKDAITLKKPNEVYYEIYKEARKKAKIARKVAIKAFLEAKKIKSTYKLDDIQDSDNDDDDFLEFYNSDEDNPKSSLG
jgi:hypothetical protein